jgi:hypothetical protein
MQSVSITTNGVSPNSDHDKVYFIWYVCQWLAAGQWFSLGTTVSDINKTDHHDIAEILLKVALNTMYQPYPTHNTLLNMSLI